MTTKTTYKPKAKAVDTPKATKAKKQTLNEFKAWLSGVEEMQAEDWSPDLSQWRRIREKIDNIEESVRAPRVMASEYEEDYPRMIRPAGPSGFAAPGLMNPQMMAPIAPPTFMNTSGVAGAQVTTPSIDTSNGQYSSGLE